MKTKIMVKTEMEIVLPMLPNYIRTSNLEITLPIEDLTEEQIREIGKQWTAALVVKHNKKRQSKIRAINKKLQSLVNQ